VVRTEYLSIFKIWFPSYHKSKTNIKLCPLPCVKVKGKAIPLQAWTGPEGSRRFRLPYFKIIGT